MYPAPPLIKICLFPVLGTVGTGGNTVAAADPTALNIIGDNNEGNKERKVVSDDEIDPPAELFATTELNTTQTTTTITICRVETMSILQESGEFEGGNWCDRKKFSNYTRVTHEGGCVGHVAVCFHHSYAPFSRPSPPIVLHCHASYSQYHENQAIGYQCE